MNNNIRKFAVLGLACAVLCAPAMAAPAHHGNRAPARAPQHHQMPAPHHRHPAPPPPPVHHRRPAPPPRVIHVEHHEANGWALLGAAIVGGIVGALAD